MIKSEFNKGSLMTCYIAKINGLIRWYSFIDILEEEVYINRIGILPSYQNKGFGLKLFKKN